MAYIQFELPKRNVEVPKDRPIRTWVLKALECFLRKITPLANPDFDSKIDDVKYWMVECDDVSGIPDREIGIDKEGRVILKMPYKDNYGYWTDNNLLLADFKKHFDCSDISRESFEHHWETFGNPL